MRKAFWFVCNLLGYLFCLIALPFLIFILGPGCSPAPEGRAQAGVSEPTEAELAKEHRRHGIVFSEQLPDGSWVFYRDGERCVLFSDRYRP